MMTSIHKQVLTWITMAGAGIGLALFIGCASWPTSYSDPSVGYITAAYRLAQSPGKADPGAAADLDYYSKAMADQYLRGLTHGTDLPAAREYVKLLQEPLAVYPSQVKTSMKLPVDWKKIQAWAVEHPERCRFSGTASKNWEQALLQAQQQVKELTDKLNRLMADGQKQFDSGRYSDAVQAYEAALVIDPPNGPAQKLKLQALIQWGIAEYDRLVPVIHTAVADTRTLTGGFHSEHSSEKLVTDSLARLDQAQVKLDDYRLWTQENEGFKQAYQQKEAAIRKEATDLATLRGQIWGERLWLLGNANQFWEAYQYQTGTWETASIRLEGGKAHEFEPPEQAAFRSELRKAYEEMLPKGLAYYDRHAQLHASEGRFGLTMTLLRIGQELLDYQLLQQSTMTDALKELQRQHQFYLNDTQDKLNKGSLSRRILLGEFKPRDTEGQVLSTLIYDRWAAKYTTSGIKDGPALFCNVKMESAVTDPADLDYLITGHVLAIDIDPLTDRELSATKVEVGSEPEVRKKDKFGKKIDPPLYVQDVLMFVKRITRVGKKVSLRTTINVANLGETSLLRSFTDEFSGSNHPLAKITLVDDQTTYSSPTSKTIENIDTAQLKPVETVPGNLPSTLSSDREIKQATLDYAADEVVMELQRKVTLFPLQYLVHQALLLQKQGKSDDAADYFGQCLEYCYQLAYPSGTTPPDWLTARKAILTKVADMNRTAWNGEKQELKNTIGDIWKQSVQAALATLKQP